MSGREVESAPPAVHNGSSSSANWDDPKLPAGDSPPMPNWPLWLSAMLWVGWVVFLVVMMFVRINTTSL